MALFILIMSFLVLVYSGLKVMNDLINNNIGIGTWLAASYLILGVMILV